MALATKNQLAQSKQLSQVMLSGHSVSLNPSKERYKNAFARQAVDKCIMPLSIGESEILRAMTHIAN